MASNWTMVAVDELNRPMQLWEPGPAITSQVEPWERPEKLRSRPSSKASLWSVLAKVAHSLSPHWLHMKLALLHFAS